MKKLKIIRKIVNALNTTDEQRKSIYNELKKRYKAMATQQRADLNEQSIKKIVDLIQPQIDLEKRMSKEIQDKYLQVVKNKNARKSRTKKS